MGNFFAALKSAFKSLGRAAMAPFTFLFGTGGGGYDDGDLASEQDEDDRDDLVAAKERQMQTAMELAGAVTRYAAASLIDDAPAPLPNDLTPEAKAWCRGLNEAECLTICNSRPESVSAHIQGLFLIPGVRRLQPLQPGDWKMKSAPPAMDDADITLVPTFSV